MSKLSMFIGFLIIAFMTFPQNAGSQQACPPSTGNNCTNWELGFYETSTQKPGCKLFVTYRWRRCADGYEIYVDEITKQGNCELLSDEGTTSSFLEWVNLVLIEEIATLSGHTPVPICPQTLDKVVFYTASCGLWVACEYEVQETQRVCDPDWIGPYPDYPDNNLLKVKLSKWQSCGVTCCKKTYKICKSWSVTHGNFDINIKSVSKETIGECTNPDNVTAPCTSGC
ncbi:MAG: hypothetical protein RO257_16625 [Candidatus Kapabacteria bacterium]|nr:hypothetical protein [Candidatus Kapabacteria bacterium]